ncbi:hypothetical protein [Fibrella aquatica]|uniref:hypothetical protein n=1 Tax=Fibrella aquatica TaxID=3242487 RepID=UPI003522D08C
MPTLRQKIENETGALLVSQEEKAQWNAANPAAFKGAWTPETPYIAGDTVTNGGNSYRRKANGTSGATFDPANWDVTALGGGVANDTIGRSKLDNSLRNTIDALSAPGYDLAEHSFALIDAILGTSFYTNKAGRLCTPQVGDISAAIMVLQALMPTEWPDQSGYTYSIKDLLDKVAIGIDRAGNLVVNGDIILRGQSISSILSGNLQAQIDALSGLIVASKNIRAIGDSLTAASYPTHLQALFSDGRTVSNGGVGGDTSTQIAFRHGAISVSVQVAGYQIPASGSVAVTPANLNIMQNGRSITATISNIAGTLARDSSGNYTFTRTTQGSIVIIDKNVMVNPVTSSWDKSICIIWMGRNNYNETATVLADIAATVAMQKSLDRRFIVMSVLNGNYAGEFVGNNNYNNMMTLNNTLRATYPRNFLDIRELLIRNYNPAIPQDVTDFNNDTVPSSLRSDNIHLTDAANQTIVAPAIHNFITLKGW